MKQEGREREETGWHRIVTREKGLKTSWRLSLQTAHYKTQWPCSHKALVMPVYSSLAHNKPNTESTDQPSNDEWISKMLCYFCAIGHYSAISRNVILMHATTWKSLNILLSEKGRLQETTCHLIPFMWHDQNRQIETKNRSCPKLEEGWMRSGCYWMSCFFLGLEYAVQSDWGDCYIILGVQ